MLTLQKKFSYEGVVEKAPVTDINIEFRIPLYEYTQKGASDPVERTAVSSEVIPVTKKLESKDYLLNLPDYFLFGKKRILSIWESIFSIQKRILMIL